MELYIIRHGETDFNRQRIVQGGGIDSELNALGHAQAHAFFKQYQDMHFDALYASDLQRTHQTLAPFVKHQGRMLCIEPALREFSWGRLEGKKPTAQEEVEFQELRNAWKRGELHRGIEGGDTPIDFWSRLEPRLWEMAAHHEGQRVLACSHGRTLRVLLSSLVGEGMHTMEAYPHHNTCLHILRFTQNQQVKMVEMGNISHLKNL